MIENLKIYFAPMAGVGDSATRQMCMKYGADGVTSEMISAKATVYGDKKTFELAKRSESENPFRIQIFGNDPSVMAKASEILCDRFSPEGIDINMGCPVPKIVNNHEGSFLMNDPDLVCEIISRVVEKISPLPVSAKIRTGFDADHITAVEVAKAIERGGADRLTVHGKTRTQMYAHGVDYDTIKRVKEAVNIPVIGNGDIVDRATAEEMLEKTGVDALMIGRGALGRPWIFDEIRHGRKEIVGKELFDIILTHLDLAIENKGEERAVLESRAQIAYYVKGIRGGADIRRRICMSKSRAETEEILKDLL